jgi:uncharacterized protein with HEPN domain
MLDHAREAIEILGSMDRDTLKKDRLVQLALTRLVEIVGEAAGRVGEPTQEKYPQIPWPQIIGMRNRLAHGYDVVDLNLLWDTIALDLPPLIGMLTPLVDKR